MVESFFLVLIVYILFYILFYKRVKDKERIRAFECGFDPKSIVRISFSYRFFLISILFIIFDVEIALILPIPFIIYRLVGVWVFFIFVFVLIVGLVYEYYCGSLDWLDDFVSKA